ncbi:MAG: hypothetical protein JW864_03205 [Spirochaetes bacterium]|nr:hypothetical protein [Spirochaetota bacterium]
MFKKILVLFIMISLSSCGTVGFVKNILKERLSVQDTVAYKAEMDQSENPALIFSKTKELQNKRIRIKDIIVNDIVPSSNVDYKFCVIVTVPTNKGNIDCYIYAGAGDIFPKEDINTISRLKKGVSVITVEGDFSKFFTLLDETYTKIEIVNADINIKGD